jgi:hypothetical protein
LQQVISAMQAARGETVRDGVAASLLHHDETPRRNGGGSPGLLLDDRATCPRKHPKDLNPI